VQKKLISAFFLLMLIPIMGFIMYFFYNKKTVVNSTLVEKQLNTSYKQEKNRINNENLSGSNSKSQVANLDNYIGIHQFSGTVSVVKDGAMTLQKSYGQKDTENGNTNSSAYRVNIQPLLNRAIIYHLVTDGKIDINERLNQFFPNLKGASKYSVDDLVKNKVYYSTSKSLPTNVASKVVLKFLNKSSRARTSGTTRSKSINTFLLSRVISDVTSANYNAYVQNLVLDRFGVLDIGLMDGTPFLQNYVNNFDYVLKRKSLQYTVPYTATIQYVSGVDNVYSTNVDTLKIINGIFKDSYLKNSQIKNLIKTSGVETSSKNNNIIYFSKKNGCSFMFSMAKNKESIKLVTSNVNAPKTVLSGIIQQSSRK